jgi:CRP-like cAMP-binding protein
VVTRLRAVGLANDFTCDFPLTQGDLADCLGTSDVHINRVLQQLRSEALAQLRNKRLSVLDWKGLIELGDFEPDYLHMPRLLATAA